MDFLGRRGIPVTEEYMQEIKTHTFESGSVYTKEKYNLLECTEARKLCTSIATKMEMHYQIRQT